MPVEFLVASHIKKRSYCSDEEKLNYNRVVMPMCKFGCDDLFEKGYISIQNGEVVTLKREKVTTFVEIYVNQIIGVSCEYWSKETKNYFDWLYKFHLK